ncbi:hypothetical protein [Streptomyces sp. CBMA152]|uniref:hypothetical protein n=1 Tax=Streptomyces sp. CBMA152 TaxID=1896312 RepID=UPI00166075D2|nr:hypothetical protein [Streptomyces sp. CBMA152]MBD0746129.1 hypothetical protein [Streptomyces sp. CBMA152]
MHGRDEVAPLLVARMPRPFAALDVLYRLVNGAPAALVFVGDRLFSVLVVEPSEDGERVSDIYAITNPEKLAGAASVAL